MESRFLYAPALQQSQRLEARVLAAPGHPMIMDLDLERLCGGCDFPRHRNIRA